MTNWTFPKLDAPTVFIGSPGDVAYLREQAKREFEVMMQRSNDRGIRLFLWEDEFSEREPRGETPYQGNIPRTDDPNCLAAIFLFGERIGSPLPRDFPTVQALSGVPASTAGTRYPLHHVADQPVPDDGFALTGSTFECLLAESAGKPMLVIFVGDASIDQDPAAADHVLDQNWGMNRLDERKQEALSRSAYRAWQDDDGIPQRLQLRSFYRHLSLDRTLPVKRVADEAQIRELIRRFLTDRLHLRPVGAALPFKGMFAYDVSDEKVFFGRDAIRRELAGSIRARIETVRPGRPAFFSIVGASGSGKSSLLRAGVVAYLHSNTSLGNWAHHVVRPGDLCRATDADIACDPLAVLYAGCLAVIEEMQCPVGDPDACLSRHIEACLRIDPVHRVQWTIERLLKALDAVTRTEFKGPWRLIIGLDQFEECLEDLVHRTESSRGDDRVRWDNVVDFLDVATRTGRVAAVCTVPEARLPQFALHRVLKDLQLEGVTTSVGFPSSTVEEIIRKSFAQVDLTLSPRLHQALVGEIRNVTLSLTGEDQGAVLPLLSLAMARIHERWQRRVEDSVDTAAIGEASARPVPDAAPPTGLSGDFGQHADSSAVQADQELSLDDYGDLARLDEIINLAGDEAIGEAGETARGLFIEDETLAAVLRPLVRFLKGDLIDLRAAKPPQDVAGAALIEALRRRRLVAEARDGCVRLVHESVLRHWTRAREWMDRERDYLSYLHEVDSDIDKWERADRNVAKFGDFGKDTLRGSAEVLYAWATTLAPVHPPHATDAEHARLYAFLCAALKYQDTPRQYIESLETGPTHFHAAVAADARSLVAAFLAADPGLVDVQRKKDGRTALFEAAFMNRVAVIEQLLAAGARPERADSEGWLPLHAAATRGHVQVLALLLSLTPVDSVGGNGRLSALHLAAQSGYEEIVGLLLSAQADVNIANVDAWTALHFAAFNGYARITESLLSKGADAGTRAEDRSTALHLACHRRHRAVVERLLHHGVDANARDRRGWAPLHHSCRNADESSSRFLLDAGADPSLENEDGWTPFHIACRYAGPGLIAMLLGNGLTDPGPATRAGWSPLSLAVAGGAVEVLEALLADERVDRSLANPRGVHLLEEVAETGRLDLLESVLRDERIARDIHDKPGRGVLRKAIRRGDAGVARLLVQYGADVAEPWEPGQDSLLHVAVSLGDEEIARLLLDAEPALVDRYDKRHQTPLHLAAKAGDRSQVDLLLRRGADARALDRERQTPIGLAARLGQVGVIRPLVDRDHETLGATDEGLGRTPLHLAADAGQEKAVAVLIDHGAAILARDRFGLTPLHLAANGNHTQVAALIIDRRADAVDQTDNDGWTPLHVAAQAGHSALVQLLLTRGAAVDRAAERPPMTALQAAAEAGCTDATSQLLAQGADIESASDGRAAPLVLAVRNMHYPTALALLDAGANPQVRDLDGTTTLGELLTGNERRRIDAGMAADPLAGILARRLANAGLDLADVVNDTARPSVSDEADVAKERPEVPDARSVVGLDGASVLFGDYDWQRPSAAECAELVERITPIDGRYPVDARDVDVLASRLPWYDDIALWRVVDPGWKQPRLAMYYLRTDAGHLFRLNGTSPPIHEVNAKSPIRLDDGNVVEYLKFFCFFVRGDEGPFYLLERADDPALTGSMDDAVRQLLEGSVRPVAGEGRDAQGQFCCNGVVSYSNALFVANFTVQTTGMVSMLGDEPIAGDLPVRVDLPIA